MSDLRRSEPQLRLGAGDAGLSAISRTGRGHLPDSPTVRVVAVGEPDALERLASAPEWLPLEPSGPVWTDDHADVLGAFVSF